MQDEHLSALNGQRFSDVLPKLVTPGSVVRYLPNRGNLGDALIAASTLRVFNRLRIIDSFTAPVVFVAGGGGLTNEYHCLSRALSRVPRDKRIVVGPSTVNDHWTLLREFPNLILMARDEMTLKLAQMHRVPCVFSHDAAFDYGYPEIAPEQDKLVAIRTDVERTIAAPEGNRDVSTLQNRKWILSEAPAAAIRFVDEIAGYRSVRTNRLHVAIAAACLGREVTLLPNSYFKNRAVFESSLSKLGVTFDP